jgi:hypothetical protein
VAFDIGFSRKGLLVVTGAKVAIELVRSVFWLAEGSESQRGGTRTLADPDVISVKGFIYDTVVAVGVSAPASKSSNIDFGHIFEQWETFTGGPWTSDDLDVQNIFSAILTAGKWTRQPNDWRYWNGKEQETHHEEQIALQEA